MIEDSATRIRRLTMRSWRRGIREMDLILGPYADAHLANMPGPGIDAFESLLGENDQDLLAWMTGAAAAPAQHQGMVTAIRGFIDAGGASQLN